MNKTELIAAVAQKSDLTKKDAEKAVKAVFEAISDSLTQGDKVQIIGFGTFEVRQRKAREAATLATMNLSRSKLPRLPLSKPANSLKIWLITNKYDPEGPHEKRPFSFHTSYRTI